MEGKAYIFKPDGSISIVTIEEFADGFSVIYDDLSVIMQWEVQLLQKALEANAGITC